MSDCNSFSLLNSHSLSLSDKHTAATHTHLFTVKDYKIHNDFVCWVLEERLYNPHKQTHTNCHCATCQAPLLFTAKKIKISQVLWDWRHMGNWGLNMHAHWDAWVHAWTDFQSNPGSPVYYCCCFRALSSRVGIKQREEETGRKTGDIRLLRKEND